MNSENQYKRESRNSMKMTGLIPSLVGAFKKNTIGEKSNVMEKPIVDTNNNNIPDEYERMDTPVGMKLSDDSRYQTATPAEKLFIRVLQLWGIDFTRIKGTQQLQAEGKFPQDAKKVGSCGTLIITLLFLFPILFILGIFFFVGYTLFQSFYG